VHGIEASAARIRKASHLILDSLENGIPLEKRALSERQAVIAEVLHDEMCGSLAVGNGGAAWPEPVHHISREGVPSPLTVSKERQMGLIRQPQELCGTDFDAFVTSASCQKSAVYVRQCAGAARNVEGRE
jgi:hypothetical protein